RLFPSRIACFARRVYPLPSFSGGTSGTSFGSSHPHAKPAKKTPIGPALSPPRAAVLSGFGWSKNPRRPLEPKLRAERPPLQGSGKDPPSLINHLQTFKRGHIAG